MKVYSLVTLFVIVVLAGFVRADIPIRAQKVASGTSLPLFVTSAPGDSDRVYILEQRGTGGVATSGSIKILDLNSGSLTTFLTIPGVSTGDEQGVLGLAFHPNYASNGLFYVNVTAPGGGVSGQTQIRQYSRVNANTASTTFSTVLTINQPQNNHNGGWMGFGPNDGMLYIASGDGGNFNDQGSGHTEPGGNAQDLSGNLLGKMLRINIDGDDFPADANRNYSIPVGNPFTGAHTGLDEIWSYGLRNPWRNSFDRQTGDLYIGDVGQGQREEINYQPAASIGGENYGWRAKEGTVVTGFDPAVPSPVVDPIHEYDHSLGIAVTGGYVYRGSENDTLNGTYFFADYGSGRVWTFKYDGTTKTKFREITNAIEFEPSDDLGLVTSFGEDSQGRLYITDRDGDIFRLVPAFPGDADLDEFVDQHDLGLMALNWQKQTGATWAMGDFTDDGKVDVLDLIVLADHWQLGPDALAAALVENGLPVGVVPEPAAGMLLGLAFLGRRSRRAIVAQRREGSGQSIPHPLRRV